MALVKCYDPEGNEHIKEPVDARECCQYCRYTMSPPEKTGIVIEDVQEEAVEVINDKPRKGKKD